MGTSPPLGRRLLGTALRRYRERVGYTMADAALILESDISKISRIETGQRGIRPKELRQLLGEYGVPGPEADVLLSIVAPDRRTGWWRAYTDVLTDSAREYFQVETAATRLQVFDPQQFPDLVRTSEYASAVAGPHREDRLDARRVRAELTLARQQAILKERQPDLAVVIDEAVLHRVVGGQDVMRQQLRRLARLAGMPGITIQILPFASGIRGICAGGPVTIVTFAGTSDLGGVYLNRSGRDDIFLVEPADLAYYGTALTEVRSAALSPDDTALLLRELSDGRGPVRGDVRVCAGGQA